MLKDQKKGSKWYAVHMTSGQYSQVVQLSTDISLSQAINGIHYDQEVCLLVPLQLR